MMTRGLAVGLCLIAGFLVIGKNGKASFEEKFGVRALDAEVRQFWWFGFGMDHTYLWVLEPANDVSIRAIVDGARLAPPHDDSEVDGPPSGPPDWWDQAEIDQLQERYVRSSGRAYWRLWIDRRSGRMFALWFDT